MVDPTSALLTASEGNYILVLLSIMVLAMLSVFALMVRWILYENPKRWEEATSRILDKFDLLITAYREHDMQAKAIKCETSEIKETTSDIRDRTKELATTIERRPCIVNGGNR